MTEKITTAKRELDGVVVGNKMQNTVIVEIETKKQHPRYKKIVKTWKKYKAHTTIECEVGDKVVIRESSPVSKDTHWVVVSKLAAK